MRAYRKYRKTTLQTWWERVLTNHPAVETTRKALAKIAYIEIEDFLFNKNIVFKIVVRWSERLLAISKDRIKCSKSSVLKYTRNHQEKKSKKVKNIWEGTTEWFKFIYKSLTTKKLNQNSEDSF